MKKELEIKFRKPKRSEYKEFARVQNSDSKQYRKFFTPEECGMLYVGMASEKELIESEKRRKLLIGMIEDKMVGAVSYYIKPNGVLWVSMINVLPKYQGKGIGRRFLAELERRAKRTKVKAIALEAQKKATWAVGFYKKNSYKALNIIDVNKKPFRGILEKPLTKHSYVFGKIIK